MTKKVVIYARVSTLDQTVDNQLIELRDYCSKMDIERSSTLLSVRTSVGSEGR